jgi:hypothetical protein
MPTIVDIADYIITLRQRIEKQDKIIEQLETLLKEKKSK